MATESVSHGHVGLQRHPPGLCVLFATEMWERFSFYSMLAMFTLYLRDADEGFGWTASEATTLYSNYLMFVYASPLVGGFLANWKLGFRRAVMIGGLFFIAGHLLLSFRSLPIVYLALVCLVIGNGFFKPNISAMVGNLYPSGSHLKDRAYNIFYMGINVGAFLAPVTAEFVKGAHGYHPAFAVAAGGMVISVAILWLFKAQVEEPDPIVPHAAGSDIQETAITEDIPPSDGHAQGVQDAERTMAMTERTPAGGAPRTGGVGTNGAADLPSIQNPIDAIPDWKRIGALLVIFAIVIVFWMVFHQNGSTMTYWANKNTDWTAVEEVVNTVRASTFFWEDEHPPFKMTGVIAHAINPFFVVTLTFPLVWFWKWLDAKGLEPSTPMKMAIGMVLASAAFVLLFLGARVGEAGATDTMLHDFKVSPLWLVGTYAVLTLAELMLSPMGLALVAKVAPSRFLGLMMGGWFVAGAIGNKLTVIGVYWDQWLHSTFWIVLSALALLIALVLLGLLKPLKKAMPGV
ncbi:MAG: peptide MFS transporter [Planctomycetes bacterium]|nr:peptide MFS transporter [Planctomycetota bacterium]